MRYGYEVQQDGTKTIHAFPDDASRARWITGSTSTRGILSGNSRKVKAALYRDTVVFEKVASLPRSANQENPTLAG